MTNGHQENASDLLASYRTNDAIAALPRLRIVHLSDLHLATHPVLRRLALYSGLNGHDEPVCRALGTIVESLKPHLLFATGDHTTWGDKRSLAAARSFLLKLAWSVGISHENVHWIPGNHDILIDYYCSFLPSRRAYDGIFGEVSPVKILTAAGYKVAIYSFDSTLDRSSQWSPLWPFVGSRGSVSRDAFNRYNDAVQKHPERDKCFKIAQIHHHPLPIPYKTADGVGLELTTMTNGGTFIAYMQESGVDLVLHGHEHHPYSCRYCFDPEHRELVVAAAGSASQKGAPFNSFNYLEVVPNTRIIVNEYRYTETGFRRQSSKVFVPTDAA